MLIDGNAVNELQLFQVLFRSVQLEVLIDGNDVNPLQSCQALTRLVLLEASINGNDVRPEHPYHAELNVVTFAVRDEGHTNDVILFAPFHAKLRSVPRFALVLITVDVI